MEIASSPVPFYVGPGVTIEGCIKVSTSESDPAKWPVARIEGQLIGDIDWEGRVEIMPSAVLTLKKELRCHHLVNSGTITGDESVAIDAALLTLQTGSKITAQKALLPEGGLEQQRGSVLNCEVDMDAGHNKAAILQSLIDFESQKAKAQTVQQPDVVVAAPVAAVAAVAAAQAIEAVSKSAVTKPSAVSSLTPAPMPMSAEEAGSITLAGESSTGRHQGGALGGGELPTFLRETASSKAAASQTSSPVAA